MRTITFISILFITSCKNNDSDSSVVKQQIIAVTSDYNKAWETLNVEKIAEFHSNQSFLYYWHGDLASKDNDHFRKLFPEILASTKEWSIKKTSEPIIQVMNKNAAIISFTLEAESIGLDGTKSKEMGALTYVWNKIDGKWKIVHIHDSPK
jgi:ketosteroid isomerase-like protein